MKKRDAGRALLHLLGPVARGWRQAADGALAGLGVSGSAGWCLVHLAMEGTPPRQAELAQWLDVSAPSLVRTLDQLQKAGWIERVADADDGRSNRVALTPAGKAVAGEIQARLDRLGGELLSGLPDGAIEIGAELLGLMRLRIAEEKLAQLLADGRDDPGVDARP
ncbi:MarR family winged helix-turn-helix transcriptional regulator [Sphingobium xenophagum]|nr:MarR family transcriptional regulator [Sphingobium xenophagum]